MTDYHHRLQSIKGRDPVHKDFNLNGHLAIQPNKHLDSVRTVNDKKMEFKLLTNLKVLPENLENENTTTEDIQSSQVCD